jgi:RHS repeat-associated protein
MLTNASGGIVEQYEYDAFGQPYVYNASGVLVNRKFGSPAANRFLFTGREWIQDMRVYDFRARLYQPELGRFLQPDPLEFAAGDNNLYRYCHNDPVNSTDPTGLREQIAGEIMRDEMWDMARYADAANTSQGSFADFTNRAYMGAVGSGGDRGGGGDRRYSFAQISQNSQGDVRHGDGYGSSAVEAGLTREGDAKKIARGDTEGVTEIGQDTTNPRQFYSPPAHGGNKEVSNLKDKVKTDNAPVATSWIDPARLPANYKIVGGVVAYRLFAASRAKEDIQRAKNAGYRTFIMTAPERKVPVVYDKYNSPNPTF